MGATALVGRGVGGGVQVAFLGFCTTLRQLQHHFEAADLGRCMPNLEGRVGGWFGGEGC